MGLFGRKQGRDRYGIVVERRIPPLNPDYFASIHQAIENYGGNDSFADVAYGVANAIENTAPKYFAALGNQSALRQFEQEFDGHAHDDVGTADRMIDWLLRWDHASQEPLEELLGRLRDVLSRPPR